MSYSIKSGTHLVGATSVATDGWVSVLNTCCKETGMESSHSIPRWLRKARPHA